jgi:tRNA 2-thiouridine synthesizing protein A
MSVSDRDEKPIIIDATGLSCPLPVLRVQKAIGSLNSGDMVTLHATDPMSWLDIPHYCQQSGHELISQIKQPHPKNATGGSNAYDTVYIFDIRHK